VVDPRQKASRAPAIVDALRSSIGTLFAIVLGALAACFSEADTPGTDTRTADSSGMPSSATTTASSETGSGTGSSTSAATSAGSGSAGESSTSSSSTSDLPAVGTCEFTEQVCSDDGDCGIAGICYADTQSCFHRCENDVDCPEGTLCFVTGAFGSYCVGCNGDDDVCAGGAVCMGNDCAEPKHPECDTSGMPCMLSEPCVLE
jgi:hypothetical protein